MSSKLSNVIGARGLLREVGPRKREIPGDERVSIGRYPARDLHGRAIDLVDLAGKADRCQLVVARIKGHRLEHVHTGAQEF